MSIIHWSVHSVGNVLQPSITTVTLDIGQWPVWQSLLCAMRLLCQLFLANCPEQCRQEKIAQSSAGNQLHRAMRTACRPICGKKASLSASLKSRHQVPTGLYGADDVLTRLHPLHVKKSSGKFQIGCIVIALHRRRCLGQDPAF